MKTAKSTRKSRIISQIAGLVTIILLVSITIFSCDFALLNNQDGDTTTTTVEATTTTLPGTTTTTTIAQLTVTSASFTEGGLIDELYCFGANGHTGLNISPQLTWSGEPAETVSFTIVVDDETAANWSHWILYNLPDTTNDVPENYSQTAGTGGTVKQGVVDGGTFGYEGPYPPTGTHTYFFRVYALDTDFPLLTPPNATRAGMLQAMDGHIVGYGEMTGIHAAH